MIDGQHQGIKRLENSLENFLLKLGSLRGLIFAVIIPYLIICAYHAINLSFLDDEGVLNYMFPLYLKNDFFTCLFWQKTKPVFAILYLPSVFIGFTAYIIQHILISALSLYLLFLIGRSIGLKYPVIPPVLLALSLIYIFSAVSGVSNSDGIFFSLLFLYFFIVRKEDLLSGIILGLLFWVRLELGLFVLVMIGYAILHRRRLNFFIGIALFPLIYTIAGAIYHNDIFWLFKYPGALYFSIPGNPAIENLKFSWANIKEILINLTLLSPLYILLSLLNVRKITAIEKYFGIFFALYLLCIFIFPFTGLFNIDFASRTSIQCLPFAVLLLGRVLESFESLQERKTPVLISIIILAIISAGLYFQYKSLVTVIPLSVLGVYGILNLLSLKNLTIILSVLFSIFSLPIFSNVERVNRNNVNYFLEDINRWLSENTAQPDIQHIYTNIHTLDMYLYYRSPLDNIKVHYLVQYDQLIEIKYTSNKDVGQTDRLINLANIYYFGIPEFPAKVLKCDLPTGSLFILIDDLRLFFFYHEDFWKENTEILYQTDHITISKPLCIKPSFQD